MKYLSYIGEETLYREYKSFSFQHIGIPFEEEYIADYLKTFRWDFNSLVFESLEKYARIYLPRYFTAFLDCYTPEEEDGVLYIGINDSGCVTGIPFQGRLYKEEILTERVRKYLSQHLLGINHPLDRLVVDLISVDYEMEEDIPPTHPHITEYYKQKKKLDDKIKDHSKEYLVWQKQNDLYSQKLVDLYRIPKCRANFIKYLREKGQYDIIRQIKNGAVIEQQKYDKIREFRESGNNLYSWLCQWKDDTLDVIRKNKPLREKSYKNITSKLQAIYRPVHIFTKTEDLIPWWMKHNEGMNLYVIRFTFLKRGYDPLTDIRFIDYLKRVVRCYRTISEKGQPCCIPY